MYQSGFYLSPCLTYISHIVFAHDMPMVDFFLNFDVEQYRNVTETEEQRHRKEENKQLRRAQIIDTTMISSI